LSVGWASWAEVDIDFDDAKLYEVCYGSATGPSKVMSGFAMGYFYTAETLESDGVPSVTADLAIADCNSYGT
jgi:hypothetical protein